MNNNHKPPVRIIVNIGALKKKKTNIKKMPKYLALIEIELKNIKINENNVVKIKTPQ